MSLTKDFHGQILKWLYLRMGGLTDIEQKGCEVIRDHERDHLVIKVRCKDLLDSDWGDLRCWCAVDSSSIIDIAETLWTHHP